MKINPVKTVVKPEYPDKYEVDINRMLLNYKPARWIKRPMAGVTLAAIIAFGLTGCVNDPAIQEAPETSESTPGISQTTGAVKYKDVPFFEHGKGIGVYGCLAISAPVYLSEEDAYAIISAEFRKKGLVVKKDGDVVKNIELPVTQSFYTEEEVASGARNRTKKGNLTFDFKIEDKNIVMEYISRDDIKSYEVEGESRASVGHNEVIDVARRLNNSLNNTDTQKLHAVFYDPVEEESRGDYGADKQSYEQAREKSETEMKAQVNDFINWLIAQGII